MVANPKLRGPGCLLRAAFAGALCLAQFASGQSPEPEAGAVKENSRDGLAYIWAPEGVFHLGCVPQDRDCGETEKPRREVRLREGFWIGRTEVTVEAYERFTAASGRPMPPAPNFDRNWQLKRQPVVMVSWLDAQAYCEWAGGRLPTEAEWEYAARAGLDGLKYPWGDEIRPENANYGGRVGLSQAKDQFTSPAGSFPANNWGLFDMAGNVWEWTAGEYDGPSVSESETAGDSKPSPVAGKAVRGGSWWSEPGSLRVSHHLGFPADSQLFNVGFRCVLQKPAEAPASTSSRNETIPAPALTPAIPPDPVPAETPGAPESKLPEKVEATPAENLPASAPQEETKVRKETPQKVYLQVAASREEAKAGTRADELKRQGYPAFMENQGDGWFRVLIGPFDALPDAKATKTRLEKAGVEAFVRKGVAPAANQVR